ncbi:MAG: hypothetical protein JSR27_02900 [Proteobacteria bacterium]|nr:hypothetical protein [Pseudomonadota bacterium]
MPSSYMFAASLRRRPGRATPVSNAHWQFRTITRQMAVLQAPREAIGRRKP